jgi:hypothetical protein
MDVPLANGLWIGAAILLIVIILFLFIFVGRQDLQRRAVVLICTVCDLSYRLRSEPRLTLFHALLRGVESFYTAYKALKKWAGRLYGGKMRPLLQTSGSSLLPLHLLHPRVSSQAQNTVAAGNRGFFDLPPELRTNVYEHLLLPLPGGRWNITNTLTADPNFLDTMAFIRSCKVVREELGPLLFRSLRFETDAKYPFYRNLPPCLTGEIRSLSLHFRPSMDHTFIHHTLLRQLRVMRNLCKLTVDVARRVLIDLDREFEYILRRFKVAHPWLSSLTVTTRISVATPTDDLVLSHAMRWLTTALLPAFGFGASVQASIWTEKVGKGRFRPGTGWFCRISTERSDWGHLPDGEE